MHSWTTEDNLKYVCSKCNKVVRLGDGDSCEKILDQVKIARELNEELIYKNTYALQYKKDNP